MYQTIRIASWTGILGSLGVLASLNSSTIGQRALLTDITDPSDSIVAWSGFPMGEPRHLDFEVTSAELAPLTSREQRDQLKDWTLFTIVADAGLDPNHMSEVLFDRPHVRYGYMAETGSFEYGATRSVYIGDGTIIAALPAGPRAQRWDYLARIVDEHYANTAERPKTILPFEYAIDLDGLSGEVTRNAEIDATAFFSDSGGFVTATLRTARDLRGFLRRIDDVVSARVEGDKLVIAGRKLKAGAQRGLGIEDVAALWQAERRLHERRTRFEREWDAKFEALNEAYQAGQRAARFPTIPTSPSRPRVGAVDTSVINSWRRRNPNLLDQGTIDSLIGIYQTPLWPGTRRGSQPRPLRDRPQTPARGEYTPPALVRTKAEADREVSKYQRAYREAQQMRGIVEGSGFSLDPAYDYPGLRAEFAWYESLLSQSVGDPAAPISAQDVSAARRGLARNDVNPLFSLTLKLRNSKDHNYVGHQLEALIQKYNFQAARYDGDLGGTEVGMVLFYTDLLAKLWALDYAGSTPDRQIEDFPAMVSPRLSPVYRAEIDSLSRTRLWLGHREAGFQAADNGRALLLAPIATRVYAAGSDPLSPGDEAPPNAQSAAFLGWWNDHYEEVARFEPEYQRLNQIMKWSLIITWLTQRDLEGAMGFLANVNVERSHWFPGWARENKRLRFSAWSGVEFYPRGHKGTSTEALPRLVSRSYELFGLEQYLIGGVTLSRKALFKGRTGFRPSFTDRLRRAGIDYSKSPGNSRTIRMRGPSDEVSGLQYNIRAAGANGESPSVVVTPQANAKLRGSTGELRRRSIERSINQPHSGRVQLTTKLHPQNGPVPMLTVDMVRTSNGFRVGMRSRDVARGQALARRLSRASNIRQGLNTEVNIQAAFRLNTNTYLVRMQQSERWMRIGVEPRGEVSLASGWDARIADIGARRSIRVAWIDDAAARAQLSGKVLVHRPATQGARVFELSERSAAPATERALSINHPDGVMQARIAKDGESFVYSFDELPSGLKQQPQLLGEALTPGDVVAIRRLPSGPGDVRGYQPINTRSAASRRLAESLSNGRYTEAAQTLSTEPRVFARHLDAELGARLRAADDLMAAGQHGRAAEQLNEASQIFGGRPDITVRKGLAELGRNRPQWAARALDDLRMPLSKRTAFFDELNAHYSRASGARRAQLDALGRYADWKDLQARGLIEPGDVRLMTDGRNVGLHYRAADDLAGPTVRSVTSIEGGTPIYIADSPALSALDWSASAQRSLQQVIDLDLGRVVYLPRGNVGSFSPLKISARDGTAEYSLATRRPTLERTYRPRLVGGQTCQEKDEHEDGHCRGIVIVMHK